MAIKLFKLSKPNFDYEVASEFLSEQGSTWITGPEDTAGDLAAEFAGRICYMSFGGRQYRKNNPEYIENIISQGHESVLEHLNWTFLLWGVSRSFTHQLVRHRVGFSYSQLSQQYAPQNLLGMSWPEFVREDEQLSQRLAKFERKNKEIYNDFLREAENIVPQDLSAKEKKRAINSLARNLLPGGQETAIVVTANARALRHFLDLRGNIDGDYEMREVSVLLLKELKKDAPSTFNDFIIATHNDGYRFVSKNA